MLAFFPTVPLLRYWHQRRVQDLPLLRLMASTAEVGPKLIEQSLYQSPVLELFLEGPNGFSIRHRIFKTQVEKTHERQSVADRTRTATMMFHGSADFLQVDIARNFHDVIDNNGVPVTLYEFEGVGHSIFDVGLQETAAQLQIDFFREHLGEGTPNP